MKIKIKNKYTLVLIILLLLPTVAFASTSTNYEMTQERGGPTEFDGSSSNFQFKAEVGHPGTGQSTSVNYIYDHGTWWYEAVGPVTATIQWAVPELRVGTPGTNDDTDFYLTIRTATDTDDVILFTQSALATTANDGTYSTPISLTGISAGTYDIGFKGGAHITKVLDNISLGSGNNVLNFTQADNSAPKGSIVLSAGDISGTGATPATLGDDVVNSIDLSILISELDTSDPTGNGYRSNLNQDTEVNSVDLSLLISHLDEEGDN